MADCAPLSETYVTQAIDHLIGTVNAVVVVWAPSSEQARIMFDALAEEAESRRSSEVLAYASTRRLRCNASNGRLHVLSRQDVPTFTAPVTLSLEPWPTAVRASAVAVHAAAMDTVARFATALEAGEWTEGDDIEIKALALQCVDWANAKAAADPLLGNGRDTRAVFALSEGLTLGALSWREATISDRLSHRFAGHLSEREEVRELWLRLADVADVLRDVELDADGDPLTDVGSLLAALEHAVKGTPGCVDPDDFRRRRTAALQRFVEEGHAADLIVDVEPMDTDDLARRAAEYRRTAEGGASTP